MSFDMLQWFNYSLLPFFVVLIVAEAMCVFKFKRRKFFIFRLIGSLAVGVSVVMLMSALMIYIVSYPIAGAIVYLIIYVYTLFALWFCFDEPLLSLLFVSSAAYITQNMSYRVFSILEVSGVVWSFGEIVGYSEAYTILQTAMYAVIYPVAYFLFIRRMNKHSSVHTHSLNVLLIAVAMLLITIFLCSWTNLYAYQHQYLLVINYLFSVICCLFVLAVQSGMLERSGLKRDIDVINQMWERDRQQYELSKENVDAINVMCHDLKHKIKKMRLDDSGLSDEELKQFEEVISLYDSRVKTGFEPIDVILTEKSLYCTKNNIKFNCLVNGVLLNFITPSDLYSLFGNILNNAIEAVSLIEDEDRRSVSISVRRGGGAVLIQSENFCKDEPKFKNGIPQSNKSGAHGYGMKSVKMLVEKYGGEINCTAENGVFRLSIIFPNLK